MHLLPIHSTQYLECLFQTGTAGLGTSQGMPTRTVGMPVRCRIEHQQSVRGSPAQGHSPAAAAAKSLQSTPCDPTDAAHPVPRPGDSPGKNTAGGCHVLLQCMKVESESEVAQSRPAPSNPMDCSPPGSSVHGVFQARVLGWGAIAFSRKEH